jgi:hypothetical protein
VKAKAVVRIFYVLFGALLLAVGVASLLLETGLLPGGAREAALGFAQGNLDTLHVMQEYGTLLVFVGVITLWFARHYESSRTFHWAMTATLALHAFAHWLDVRGARSLVGPVINSAPLALFLLVGLLRLKAREKKAAAGDELLPALPADLKTSL